MNGFLRLSDFMLWLSRRVARAELIVCQVLIVAFSSLLLVNVIMRYAFSAPFYFAEEAAIYILIWMAFLAIAATIARQEMIALTFAVALLPERPRLVVDLAVQLAILAMMLLLLVVSWQWLNSPGVQFETALTLGQPKRYFYAIMPVFCALASFHSFANVLDIMARLLRGAPPPRQPGPSEVVWK